MVNVVRRVVVLFAVINLCFAGKLLAAKKGYTLADDPEEEYMLQIQEKAPVVDGVINEDEWASALQIDGFSDDQRRVRGYVLPTKDAFYLAIRSQLPDSGDLVVNIDRDNTPRMVFDDSIEFWFVTDPKKRRGKKFQFMTNPNARRWGRVHGRGGEDGIKDWQAKWETKSSFQDRDWHCEAKIPLKELTDKPLTGQEWQVNLWRNWKNPWLQTFMLGRMFDWAKNTWRFTNNPAPVVHLVENANRFLGNINLGLELENPSDSPITVNVKFRLERDKGEDVVKTKNVSIAAKSKANVALELKEKNSKNCRLTAEVVDAKNNTVYFRHKKVWKIGKAIPWDAPVALPKTVLKFRCGYFPSSNILKMAADLKDMPKEAKVSKVIVKVCEKDSGKEIASGVLDKFVNGRQEMDLKLPPDMNGVYEVVAKAQGENVPDEKITAEIRRQRFPWEGNKLGVTNEVFPPFKPLVAKDKDVSPVLRKYRMNDQGLWDSVMAKEREILAGPIRYVAIDEKGKELSWKGTVKLKSAADHEVVYQAKSTCPAIEIDARSTIEQDGLMKVNLKLNPVKNPVPIKRLSLVIPLVDKEAYLMHQVHDALRQNYAGKTPPGKGEIWNSKQIYRSREWLNAFNGYIWLGGAERGLCWIAENDKGWITAKNMDEPLMRITRKDGKLVLRIDLVNVLGKITAPTELLFGMQATPTRPPLQRLRLFAGAADSSGPVMAWGSMGECNWKQPWDNRWEVIDKLLESKQTGKMDKEWFYEFEKKHNIPKIKGKRWSDKNIFIFEHMTRYAGKKGPMRMYFEEMNMNKAWPEYHVFQDEWNAQKSQLREYASMEAYRKYEEVGGGPGTAKITWPTSALDYLHWLMNEWLKRGISVKWDNFYPNPSDNPWTSAAYEAPDGRIQPAILFWNQREYLRRAWNLLNQWKRKGTPRPIDLNTHMSTTLIAPWFTWTTCNGDLEYSPDTHARLFPDLYDSGEPYDPDFLLTETVGRQVGVFPHCFHIFKATGYPKDSLGISIDKVERQRREWGMRAVHEIMGTANTRMKAFGYGVGLDYHGDKLKVWNYWDDKPAFKVDNNQVRAILFARPADKKLLLILQSWEKGPTTAKVTLDSKLIGFAPGKYIYDGFNNRRWEMKGNEIDVRFDFPYETLPLIITHDAPVNGVLFSDNFNNGCDFGWDYFKGYGYNGPPIKDGALCFSDNMATWMGQTRVYKYLNLPEFSDASLDFVFRIEKTPEKKTDLLYTDFPANGIALSRHGLSHSYLKDSIVLKATADPAKGFVWTATTRQGKKTIKLGEGISSPVDTVNHKVRIFSGNDGRYTVTVDGKEVLSATNSPVCSGNAFGFMAANRWSKKFVGKALTAQIGALYLDDVVLRAEKTDDSRMKKERQVAMKKSSEILAKRRDELLELVRAAFGVDGAKKIRNNALYNRAEENVQALLKLLADAKSSAQRQAIITLLAELPKKQQEHIDFMLGIGQPAERVPEFRRARKAAATGINKNMKKFNAETKKLAKELLANLYGQ